VGAHFASMRGEGEAWLERESIAAPQRRFRALVDARYVGQNHEIAVPCDDFGPAALPTFLERFADVHVREYGYAIPGRDVEIVNCRLQAVGAVPRAPLNRVGSRSTAAAPLGHRKVYFGADGWLDTPIYLRAALAATTRLDGPAIVDEMSSTTVVPPGDRLHVDAIGNLVIEVSHAA